MNDANDIADDLPEGWAWAELGELVQPSSEKVEPNEKPNARYLSLEHIEPHTGLILGHGKGSDVNSTKTVFRAGDVLYGKLRPYLNKVSVPNFDGICSTDILVFPATTLIDSYFLMRFLSTSAVVEFANHNSSGVQLPRISFNYLSTIDVPLPPMAEQKRIVAKVEEVLGRVTAARERLAKVPAILKRFRQAVLAAACSGQLTESWREDSAFDDDLPSGWVNAEAGTFYVDARYGTSVKCEREGDGTPVLRVPNIARGVLDTADLKFAELSGAELKSLAVQEGDLIVCCFVETLYPVAARIMRL